MASAPFTLPEGLRIRTDDGRLSVTYTGDLVLTHTMDLPLGVVECTGNVEIQLAEASGTIKAGGTVTATGDFSGSIESEGGVIVEGNFTAGTVSTPGDVAIRGNLAGEVTCDGNVRVGGNAAGSLLAGANAAIGGDFAGSITAGGNIQVEGAASGETLHAGRRLSVVGDIHLKHMHGLVVQFGVQTINGVSISAERKVTLGAATLKLDVIIAPIVQLAAEATGRVTVIECKNERAPAKIKGGFPLSEYEEVMGGSEAFLADRGLSPLDNTPLPEDADENEETEAGDIPETDDIPEADDLTDVADNYLAEALAEPEPEPSAEEDTGDPVSLTIDDLEPVELSAEDLEELPEDAIEILDDAEDGPEVVVIDDDDPISADDGAVVVIDDETDLSAALDRITACYSDGLPAPLVALQGLVAKGDTDALGTSLDATWTALLEHHLAEGTPLNHNVSHGFRLVHAALDAASA